MSGCPDIPEWETVWLDDQRMVRRRGPFRCVTHTGGQSHGIGSGEIMFGLRIPDMGAAIGQLVSTDEYLDGFDLHGRPMTPSAPSNYGTDFHGARPVYDGHPQAAGPGECDLMGSLPCWTDVTYLWDDAFDAWRSDGEAAVWKPLERRLLEWIG